MRIVVFSERLRAPYDEGIKSVAVHLAAALATEHEVLPVTTCGADDAQYGIRNVSANRLLVSARLGRMISSFAPQVIVYVPTACATLFSFLRAIALRHYGRGARIALLALQPRRHTAWGRWVIRRLASSRSLFDGTSNLVFAQSRRTVSILEKLGCRAALLPPAVDTQRFHPVSAMEKMALRDRYGIPRAATVVTHVGHLKSKRSLTQLLTLQSYAGYHTVMVASTSTEQDQALKDTLCSARITVIDTYLPAVEEIYRLSDVYLFLAEEETAAIELPLSVLEGMACNLPVISTPFGGLSDFFAEGNGLYYWRGQKELSSMVQAALSAPCATRALVQSRTWPAAAQFLVQSLSVG